MLKLLKAKRAVEGVIAEGEMILDLPKVADRECLSVDLVAAGIQPEFLRKKLRIRSAETSKRWVRKVRENAGLTQQQFAVVYGVDLKTLQKYEQGASVPAAGILSYLQMIEADPQRVKRMRIEG